MIEVITLSISYEKLIEMLEKHGINSYTIKMDKLISYDTLKRIKSGSSISITSLSRLCERMKCQPQDLIEWIDDGKHNEDSDTKSKDKK